MWFSSVPDSGSVGRQKPLTPATLFLPSLSSACLELGVHFAFRILFLLSRGYCQTQNIGTHVTLEPVSRAVSPDACLLPHSCWSIWGRARASWTWGWLRLGTHSAPAAITLRWRLWTLERSAISPWGWPGRWVGMLFFPEGLLSVGLLRKPAQRACRGKF